MRERFPERGSHLERYAQHFSCAEINSTFYRSHRAGTYERWAAAVPATFRFSLKVPKEITHTRRLAGCENELDRFLDETAKLGAKRGALLVQLPPSFAFEPQVVHAFFETFRRKYAGKVVCEPRHVSWYTPAAGALLTDFKVARCGADPVLVPGAGVPLASGIRYFRWHGSPRTYYSSYDETMLREFADRVRSRAGTTWCIFDNTAGGAAAGNALDLQALLNPDGAGALGDRKRGDTARRGKIDA